MPVSPEKNRVRNRKYHAENKAKENARSLAYYHEKGKVRVDREKRRAYMKEYHRKNPRKRTLEIQAEHNRRRREKYATDASYRERQKAEVKRWQTTNVRKRK